METILKTAPTKYPVTLNEAKRHMRIPLEDTDNDQYILACIQAATGYVEEITWRKLITQTWYAYLQDWPGGKFIEIPFGSLQSVTAVKYTDVDGDQSTWTAAEYIVGTDYLKGRITLADGYTWPNEVLYPSNPIEIEFVCGYGLPIAVPFLIRQSIYLLIAEFYENREISLIGTIMTELPMFMNLISQFRLNTL